MLKEVWLDIEIKKTDTYKGVTIKALLDSGAIGIFIDRKTVAKHGFKQAAKVRKTSESQKY